jgi:hypothetical protein
LGGDGSGSNNFVAIIVIVSLQSLVSVAQKEDRNNDKQRGINIVKIKKNCNWGPSRNMKEGFQFHFNIKRPCW